MRTTTELDTAAPSRPEPVSRRPAQAPAGRHRPTGRHDDQPILSIRGSVPRADAGRFIAEALRDIRVFMQEHHVSAAGPPFSICRPRGSDVDIEAGWPIGAQRLAGTSRIHAGTLPRSLTGPRDDPDPVDGLEGRRY
jgi:hypothetical protein